MPKTGVLIVPRPRFRPRARWAVQRFRQNPPQIGFIDFHRALKDRGHLPLHRGAHEDQRSQDPLTMELGLLGNGRGAEFADMASQQGLPLMPRQPQGQARPPFVSAPSAPMLVTTDNPRSSVPTARTSLSSRHASSLPK